MPTKKKTEKKTAAFVADIMEDVTNPKSTNDTKDVKDTSDTRDEFRFSARFTPQQWKFLQEKKWQESAKNHKSLSITQILQDYVEEDMKKHPEILKAFDELNG